MKLYISHNYREINSAGNKAKSDVEQILQAEGWQNVGLPKSHEPGVAKHFSLNLKGILRASFSIEKDDVLFIQYPLNKYFSYITRMARMRGAKTVVLIHDLNSYRLPKIGREIELMRLRKADYLIPTNAVMGEILRKLGLKNVGRELGVWDYLTDSDPISSRIREDENEVRIAYAGEYSKEKNRFVWEWGNHITNYVVDIYGRGFRMGEVDRPEKFFNHGYVDQDKLISGMTADYGLVWDGDSVETCTGNHGEYLRINTPHKLSLYIRAHLPIIIWKDAAMAKFVTENNIGFTVKNLDEINARLAEITPEQYDEMKRNVVALSERIAAGHHLREALKSYDQLLSIGVR